MSNDIVAPGYYSQSLVRLRQGFADYASAHAGWPGSWRPARDVQPAWRCAATCLVVSRRRGGPRAAASCACVLVAKEAVIALCYYFVCVKEDPTKQMGVLTDEHTITRMQLMDVVISRARESHTCSEHVAVTARDMCAHACTEPPGRGTSSTAAAPPRPRSSVLLHAPKSVCEGVHRADKRILVPAGRGPGHGP